MSRYQSIPATLHWYEYVPFKITDVHGRTEYRNLGNADDDNFIDFNKVLQHEVENQKDKVRDKVNNIPSAENVDELSKLMSEEDIAEYIKYDTETPEKFSAYDKMINEDGTFANDRKGMKQVALLMKLKITNNGDEDFQFLSNGFRLYCFRYNKQDDATYYSTIESRQSYLNIHDDHEIFRHHLTIKPGETKEVVAMEFIPYEFVTSYTRTTANVGGQYIDTYKDITTDGLTVDSLYTCYSTTDKAFPVGSPIVKLDIDR